MPSQLLRKLQIQQMCGKESLFIKAIAESRFITEEHVNVNEGGSPMQKVSTQDKAPAARNLVVGLFTDVKDARGAIVDLSDAGFGKNQIRVAFSDETKALPHKGSEVTAADHPAIAGGEKSLVWRLRQSFVHDLYRSGTYQIKGEDQNQSSGGTGAPCSEVDLSEALSPLKVAESTIRLLSHEIGRGGALVLVDAVFRCNEAQAILERNAGIIRTDTATERAHTNP
jgi:hypothetical protein